MAKFKSTSKSNKLKALGCAIALPICATGIGILCSNSLLTKAEEYVSGYSESVTVNNGSFQNGGGEYSSGNSLSGWEAVDKTSDAKGMLINVGPNFNDNRLQYKLENNPGSTGLNDSRILMINSRSSDNGENRFLKQGYTLSNDLTLQANSYYRLTIDAKTSLDDRDDGVYSAYASIYLDGLKNADGENIPVYYEELDNTGWRSFYFFVATGNQSQSVNIGLYLGSKNIDSTGVVFFDEVSLTRFSENTFYEVLNNPQYGYANADVTTGENFLPNNRVRTRFVIDALKQNDDSIVDTSDLNFDFDHENSLSPFWKVIEGPSAKSNATIMQVDGMDDEAFKLLTGTKFNYVGDDLSVNNKNALVLYSDEPSYLTIQSKPFNLPAHALYKISLHAKISSLSGNFSVGIVESRKTDDNGDDISGLPTFYQPATFSKNGFTSNGTDKFFNNYTTVDLYVKGHELYSTQIALQIGLGTKENNAQGCVLFDSITISNVDYVTFSNANSADKTELKIYTTEPEFTNGNFDKTENATAKLDYPLLAQGFTAEKNEYSESGVVFVPKDESEYDRLYRPSYDSNGNIEKGFDWYIASPQHPKGYDENNNVYMMFNGLNTYQTLTCPTFSAGSDVTELSFNLKTVSTTSKEASIAIEISDSNGIVLLYREGISANVWTPVKLYIQGGQNISSTLTLKIHFGQQKTENYDENLMRGYVFLDDFATRAGATLPEGKNADVDLTDLYLNLDPYGNVGGSISKSSAYTFANENLDSNLVGQCSSGGVVLGKENEYDIESNSNILVLSATTPSKSSLTSNFSFSLEGSSDTPSYYKLAFTLRTKFGYDELENSDQHKCTSGVSIGLDLFEKATNLRSDEEFVQYTIFVKSTESASAKIVFALDCDCDNTCGNAYLSNLSFESATEDDYAAAQNNSEYGKTVFTTVKDAENNEDTESEPQEPSTTPAADSEQLWIIIPSLVMALAVVVAILAFALRKVKFKKIEKTKRENYDRIAYVNHDLMLKRAQEQRDQEAEEIRTALQNLAQERADLENEHKEAVKASRSAGGKVTKTTERQFKAYAQKIAKLGEKEEILHEQLEETMSADYLISVEKRLADEEEKQLKEMTKQKPIKQSKQENDQSDQPENKK